MDLSSLTPITIDPQQSDPICGSKNAGKTAPGGSEFESSSVEAPTSFAASIEEAFRRLQVSGQDQATQKGKIAPVLSLDQPTRQDFGLSFLPTFSRTEAETLEDGATTASSVSTLENAGPNAGVAFLACAPIGAAVPVSGTASTSLVPASAAQEPASTRPLDAPAGPASSAGQNSGTPVFSSPLARGEESPASDPGLAASLTMTSETLRRESSCVPQNAMLAPPVARAATQEPSRPQPSDPSTPGTPGLAATPEENRAAVSFTQDSAAGRTPNAGADTDCLQKNSAGRTGEPVPPQASPTSADHETVADDASQDGQAREKMGGAQNAPSTAPSDSTRPALQRPERPLPPTVSPGTEETGSLQQAGTKAAETPHGTSGGTGKNLPTTGPSTGGSLASHLQIRAQEALESSAKQFHLRIQAEGLGDMLWDVRLEPGRIAAHALVDTPRLQEMVRAQQDALIQKFQELGLEVESFEVLINSGSTGERFLGRQTPESGDGVRQGRAPSGPARSPVLPARGTDQGLDLFV